MSKKVNSLVEEWKDQQEEMEKAGMNKKSDESLKADKRKNSDLQILKKVGGPFAKPEEVVEYLALKIPDGEKQSRLYTEVRYARDNATSLPKKSEMFRLKQKHKPLPTERLAENLRVFLGKVSTNSSATWSDFDNAVSKISKNVSA